MRTLATTYDAALYSTDPNVVDYNTYGPAYNPMAFWVWLTVAVVVVISLWKIFTKAGQPGWASIVPFYNIWVMLKVVGRPGWWLILYFIPLVNIVISLIVALDMAKVFGKSGVFGFFGLFIFGFIGYPILAFGDAKYVKSAAKR